MARLLYIKEIEVYQERKWMYAYPNCDADVFTLSKAGFVVPIAADNFADQPHRIPCMVRSIRKSERA